MTLMLQLTLLSSSVFDVALPVPGSPSCCSSLSFSLLLVQMQQKSIIIFSLLKLGLAELKMNLLSETSALLRRAPDAAWVLISMPGIQAAEKE